MFSRLGTWCHDHRKLVLLAWVLVVFFGQGIAGGVGNQFRDEFNLPDVESRQGFDILDEEFGSQGTGIPGTIVFQAEQGVEDPEVQARFEALFERVADVDDIDRVVSPYSEEGAQQISSRGPEAGTIAYASLEMPEDMPFARGLEIRREIEASNAYKDVQALDGVRVEFGGFIFGEFEPPQSEILGLAFAIVILIVAFGSVLAMGLPVGVALFGIGLGTALITLLSNVLAVPEFATFLGIMIGLGVGIDYALLIVTRFREQLHAGHTVRESVGIALDTAGRASLFAGTTVVISLVGMLVMQVSFVTGLAVSTATVVAVTVAASLTLLPALIGFAGHRVELTRWRGLIAAGLVAIAFVGIGLGVTPLIVGLPLAALVLIAGFFVGPLKREVPRQTNKPLEQTTAFRWSRLIQHRPWPAAILAAGILIVLALPVLGLRLGFSDESNLDEDTTTRQAYDLLAEGFGPGFNGPFILATRLPEGTTLDQLEAVNRAVADDPGVDFVSPPQPNDPDNPTAAIWQLFPASAPQDPETTELVSHLRDTVLPPAEQEAGVDVLVTGSGAVNVDFAEYLESRLPYFFTAVLALSFLLLLLVFRSVLVPLKAVIMNLLSIGAAYGIVVALFQWGWLSDITGVQPAPIEPWIPMMLFAIVFGLSMDYEVFLLSRVREEWHRSGDSRLSVADGLAATAKVITAAALIMVVVFGSFLLENERTVKMMGVGLATAILLDATIVRMLLVPATMELLGDKNWWLPRWLDRILPNIDVEGKADVPPEDRGPDGGGTIDLAEPEPEREPAPTAGS